MVRGEIRWVQLDERCPVVLLSGGEGTEVRAMRIVAPATTQEKQGFLVLSGVQACDARLTSELIAAAGPAVRAVGVEVRLGAAEGLRDDGVVRVALPRDGVVFCTWLVTLTPEHLGERIGVLSPAKLDEVDNALRLASVE